MLTEKKKIDVRFSEVDSMGIVWHGNYMLYFEDAREAFGKRYGLDYLTIFQNGYYAPLVDINFQYKRPMVYGKSTVIEITYLPTEAAKIVFEYKITDETGDLIYAKGKSTQVFMDMNYQLIWTNPPFFMKWKEIHGVL